MNKLISIAFILAFWASCGNSGNEVKPLYKDISESVFASGTLESEGKYNLVAQSEGYLIKLNFKEGDLVKKGDVLAVVDNQANRFNEQSAQELTFIAQKNVSENAPALKQTEANLKLASEKLKQDETQAGRYKKLFELSSVSKLEYENAQLAFDASKTNYEVINQNYQLQKQQAEQQLISQMAQRNVNSFFSENNKVKAIEGGKIYRKLKELGDYVRKGDVLASIGNPNDIYAKLSVDESNIAKIKVGQDALIQLNTNKETSLKGKVSEILPAFEEATQSFICKVKFSEPLPLSISGTQLQANISIGTKSKVLVIPRSFLDYGNKVNVKGRKDPIVVSTGFVSNEWVEINDGLKSEDILLPISK